MTNAEVENLRHLSMAVAILVARLGGDVTITRKEMEDAPPVNVVNSVSQNRIRLVTKSEWDKR